MSLQERMNDAVFEIHTPICKFCCNLTKITQGQMNCAVKDIVPRDIDMAKSIKCKEFILDPAEWDLFKPLMPEGFDPATITE